MSLVGVNGCVGGVRGAWGARRARRQRAGLALGARRPARAPPRARPPRPRRTQSAFGRRTATHRVCTRSASARTTRSY